ncbi:MAG: pimeloyl-ACP methyl ester carboxylesterase [Polaribacter sp.]|jgi:pimeloyl-ACP methyl ester carboxylesterase
MKIKIIGLFLTILSTISYSTAQNKVEINEGSGSFIIQGGKGFENINLTVHYHKPKKFNKSTKVLIVIPGSGRNSDSYRDSWIQTSEKHNVLILSPSYPEKNYNYGGYHLGNMITVLDLRKGFSYKKGTNQVWMDENVAEFNFNTDSKTWIYSDFDRIFSIAKKTLKFKAKKYDMFGHSAGGQILHRFAIFYPQSKANRILASNAGSYTPTEYQTNYPFGIKNTNTKKKNLKKSFRKNLTIFLGELDNADENGGKMLRSKTVDIQGTHRLARGTYFYNHSLKTAKELNFKYNWKLKVIPGIGHNQRKMAKAAAKYLYDN